MIIALPSLFFRNCLQAHAFFPLFFPNDILLFCCQRSDAELLLLHLNGNADNSLLRFDQTNFKRFGVNSLWKPLQNHNRKSFQWKVYCLKIYFFEKHMVFTLRFQRYSTFETIFIFHKILLSLRLGPLLLSKSELNSSKFDSIMVDRFKMINVGFQISLPWIFRDITRLAYRVDSPKVFLQWHQIFYTSSFLMQKGTINQPVFFSFELTHNPIQCSIFVKNPA